MAARTPRNLNKTPEQAGDSVVGGGVPVRHEQQTPLAGAILRMPYRALSKKVRTASLDELLAAQERLWTLRGTISPTATQGHLRANDVDVLIGEVEAQIKARADAQTRAARNKHNHLIARPYLSPSLAHHHPDFQARGDIQKEAQRLHRSPRSGNPYPDENHVQETKTAQTTEERDATKRRDEGGATRRLPRSVTTP